MAVRYTLMTKTGKRCQDTPRPTDRLIHACGVLQQHDCAIGVYYDYVRCILTNVARQAILGFTIHQICFSWFSLNIFYNINTLQRD